MDAMGDADEAGGPDGWDGELRHLAGRSVRTPEAQAFTAAGGLTGAAGPQLRRARRVLGASVGLRVDDQPGRF